MKKFKRILPVILLIVVSLFAVFYLLVLLIPNFLDQSAAKIGLIGIISLIIILIIILFVLFRNSRYIKALENRLGLWNTISYQVKGAGETAFNELPVGILVLDNMLNIVWSNNQAKVYLQSELNDLNLKKVANGVLSYFLAASVNNASPNTEINLYDKVLDVKYSKQYNVIYLSEVTAFKKLQRVYNNHLTCLGYINIDNFEEAIGDLDAQERSIYSGKIISAITEYAKNFDSYVRALSDSKYIIITDAEHLRLMKKDNFSVLDEIRLIVIPSKQYSITLSAGIVCRDDNITVLDDIAQERLDMALNRGGDQIVVDNQGALEFYGAKSEPSRKESMVDIRFKYEGLERLIKGASKVFVVSHRNGDADSFGSSLAAYKLSMALGKDAYIILEEDNVDATVSKVLADIDKYRSVVKKSIISIDKAISMVDENALLIVCDCQALSNLIMTERDLEHFPNIAIVDHHRRNESGVIENAKFYYCEPAASSCVEVMFTLFEFCKAPLSFTSIEATWMLLGIVVDTNNFVYRTTPLTFEVASTLNRWNANISMVQNYLKEDLSEKTVRNELIAGVEIYGEERNVAIACQKSNNFLSSPILAKVSDDLLTIEKIQLAVTVAYTAENTIRMSARSLGDLNCQVLMEHLGGGGHLTGAACELKDVTKEEALAKLKVAIDNLLNDSPEKIKIILTENLKNYGTRGDIVSVTSSKGTNLIKNNHALLATAENIRIFEQEKNETKRVDDKANNALLALREQIEDDPIDAYVKKENDGSINIKKIKKCISSYLEEKYQLDIDESKINFEEEIDAFGTYVANIEIGNEVVAEVQIYVIDR